MLVNIVLQLERSGFLRASTPLACASNAVAQIKLPPQFHAQPIMTRVEHVPSGTSFLFDHKNANAAEQRDLKLLPPKDPREASATIFRFISGRAILADVKIVCSDDVARYYFPRIRKLWENGLIDTSFDINPPPPQLYPDLPPPEFHDPANGAIPLYRATTMIEATIDIDASENHRGAAANAMSLLPGEYSTISCETSSASPYSSAFIFHRFGHAFNNIDERTAPIQFHKSADVFQLTFEHQRAQRGLFLFPIDSQKPNVLPSLIPQLASLWAKGFITSP